MNRKKLLFPIVLFLVNLNLNAGWLCHKASSLRDGNRLTACGIGFGKNEAEARSNALKTAYDELDAICNRSIDCKDKELFIEPLRNECVTEKKEFKCYRGISATITKKKKKKETIPTKEAQTQKVEVIIKNEIQELEKVTRYSCDYDYNEVENLLKSQQMEKAVEKIKLIPFKLQCNKFHFQFMTTLLKLKAFPDSYTDYLYSLVSTFEGDWNDPRPLAIFEFLYEKGPWNQTGWKRIYLAVKSGNPRQFYQFSKLLFHLNDSDQKKQKERILQLLKDTSKNQLGFPDKLEPSVVLSYLCRVPDKKEEFWFLEEIFSFPSPSIKEREKDLLGCLEKSLEFSDTPNKEKKIYSWMERYFQKPSKLNDAQDFVSSFLQKIDREIEKLDDTLEEDEKKIEVLKNRRVSFLAIIKKHQGVLFSEVKNEWRKKTFIELCIKEKLSCKIVPTFDQLKKRLTSKKDKTVEEATHYLTLLPDHAFKLKDDLLSLLENHKYHRVRSLCMEALVRTPIKDKKDLDILLKHSWNRVYDYSELAKVMGKRLLISLKPIAADPSHRNRDLAIDMIGMIGKDAAEAKPLLEKILEEKPHYSTADRVKKALNKI